MARHCKPKDFKALYRQLGISDAFVEQARFDNRDLGILEASIVILQKWRQTAGRHATRLALVKSLKSSCNLHVAHMLEDELKKSMKTSSSI